jgi:hypothetical protein
MLMAVTFAATGTVPIPVEYAPEPLRVALWGIALIGFSMTLRSRHARRTESRTA